MVAGFAGGVRDVLRNGYKHRAGAPGECHVEGAMSDGGCEVRVFDLETGLTKGRSEPDKIDLLESLPARGARSVLVPRSQ